MSDQRDVSGQARHSEIGYLHEIGSRFAAAESLETVLNRVVHVVSSVVQCDSCFIYVLVCQRIDGRLGDPSGRQHHPHRSRPLQPADKILQRAGASGAISGEGRYRFGVLVIDDRGVAVLHQPPNDIAAHPAKADHAELHSRILILLGA